MGDWEESKASFPPLRMMEIPMKPTAKKQFVPEEESSDAAADMQRKAVREMLDFVARNHVRLRGVSVRKLIHPGEDQP
jgi:hypothetical protein